MGQRADALDPATLGQVGGAAAKASEPVSDSNGSEDYKGALVQTLVARAISEAVGRASARATP